MTDIVFLPATLSSLPFPSPSTKQQDIRIVRPSTESDSVRLTSAARPYFSSRQNVAFPNSPTRTSSLPATPDVIENPMFHASPLSFPPLPTPPFTLGPSIISYEPDSPSRQNEDQRDVFGMSPRITTLANAALLDSVLSPSTSNGVDFSLDKPAARKVRKGPPPTLRAKSMMRANSLRVNSTLDVSTMPMISGMARTRSSSPGGGVGGYATAESFGDSEQDIIAPDADDG